jgi:hypothetical protein
MSSDGENDINQGPACVQCRKKKHKCSRGEPCQSCLASGSACFYTEYKKRGAKPGYIETLTRRMDQLESLVLGQSLLLASHGHLPPIKNEGSLTQTLDQVRNTLNSAKSTSEVMSTHGSPQHDRKRKRSYYSETDFDSILPPEGLLIELVRLHFERIHPWIPILHQLTFEENFKTRNRSEIVLAAITAATIKFTDLDHTQQKYYYKRCRQAVILFSRNTPGQCHHCI